ncbi:transposable element Tcb2 transposase [Trichonephila clavipes]|uniref:Transposable element Tcb2 transposase n=1 Tax=Trichonephila clavipes TaxID=2585209 RepID=A0A8X6VFR5_TRICX|nr:transposable element Tcb2 transposase [Trichonephila clavipes]
MSLRRFRRQYEQLSQFERGRIVGMMEAVWSAKRVARQLGNSDCVTSHREDRHIVRNSLVQSTASSAAIQAQVTPSLGAPVSSRIIRRRLAEGHLGSRRVTLTPTHRLLLSEWCHARGNWTAAEWNQVLFSDESRFNLRSDDNRVRVWRLRGESLNLAFALQQHTAPTEGVMVWGAIAYNTRLPLVLICGTLTAQQYVHDFLQPHVLQLIQRLPGALFQQDNPRSPTARVSQNLIRNVTILPWPVLFPDLSPMSISGINWDGELGIPRV